jgi:hypothetical protein
LDTAKQKLAPSPGIVRSLQTNTVRQRQSPIGTLRAGRAARLRTERVLIGFGGDREGALPGQGETQQEYDCPLHWLQYHGAYWIVPNQQS